jgi:hypothetical protein
VHARKAPISLPILPDESSHTTALNPLHASLQKRTEQRKTLHYNSYFPAQK